MKPKISIVIPVHNCGQFLQRCLDSILRQTFRDFECIVTDDGSEDNSPEICDEYREKDERIIVIHQKKSGVSAARNSALNAARGDWIGFADGDDWCNPDMFGTLYDNAVKTGADISICGYNEVEEVSDSVQGEPTPPTPPERILNSKDAILEMLSTNSFGGYSWNKLVNAKFFKTNNLRYDTSVQTMSDVLLFYHIFKNAEKIVYSPVNLYNYVQIRSSIVHSPGLAKRLTGLSVWDKILSEETDGAIRNKIVMRKIDYASGVCYQEANNHNHELYRIFRTFSLSHIFCIVFSLPISIKEKASRLFCLFSPKLFLLIQKTHRGF